MEIISVLLLIICAVVFLKVLAFFLHAGIFVLTIPLKILGLLLTLLFTVFILIPAGLATVFLIPLAIITPLIPLLLIIAAVVLLLRRS
jgi:hypothetical protein